MSSPHHLTQWGQVEIKFTLTQWVTPEMQGSLEQWFFSCQTSTWAWGSQADIQFCIAPLRGSQMTKNQGEWQVPTWIRLGPEG